MTTTPDPCVIFISPEIIRIARIAAQLHRRMGQFDTLTIAPDIHRKGWHLGNAALRRVDGGTMFIDMTRPVDETSAYASESRERLAAAEELAALIAGIPLPEVCAALRIPLDAIS